MSSSYSANQYDNAFKSQRLQNWCVGKNFKERPTALKGHTTFIANDKGHLLPGAAKRGSARTDFKGTWDLPNRIPAPRINHTSRSVEGLKRLKSWGLDPQHNTMAGRSNIKAPWVKTVTSAPNIPVKATNLPCDEESPSS